MVTEEDGATVVRTEAGSVWGGQARIEERFTLDADGRCPPLADVRGIAAVADRRYVQDVQEASLHIYDSGGTYLETVGRAGPGPGEFQRPVDLALDGVLERLYVRDAMLRRITLFRLDGSLLTTWSTPTVPGLLRPMVVTERGGLYLPITLNPTDPPGEWRYGMASFGSEGPVGDTVAAPQTDCPLLMLSFAGTTRGSITVPVPFSPEEVWSLSPGRWTVSGCSNRYSITLRSQEGERQIIQRDNWDPVPVAPLEAE